MTRRTLLLSQASASAIEEAMHADRENEFARAWNAYVREKTAGRVDLKLRSRRDKLGRALFCPKQKGE